MPSVGVSNFPLFACLFVSEEKPLEFSLERKVEGLSVVRSFNMLQQKLASAIVLNVSV